MSILRSSNIFFCKDWCHERRILYHETHFWKLDSLQDSFSSGSRSSRSLRLASARTRYLGRPYTAMLERRSARVLGALTRLVIGVGKATETHEGGESDREYNAPKKEIGKVEAKFKSTSMCEKGTRIPFPWDPYCRSHPHINMNLIRRDITLSAVCVN